MTNPEKVSPKIAARAKNLGTVAIRLQWVGGGAQNAEASFLKINKQAAPINKTELELIESRKKPNCIAARAIIRSGKGHKYWSAFPSERQKIIQELAKQINELLFEPELETPVKTMDIPVGGKKYSPQSLSLTFAFVNIINEIKTDFKKTLLDDIDGIKTIEILTKCRDVAYKINSTNPYSLGLHPIVYFYSQEGRHKTTSFLAIVYFVIKLFESNAIKKFNNVRERFEEILLSHDFLIQQIGRKYRSSTNSYEHIKDFYFALIDALQGGKTTEHAIAEVIKLPKFDYLKIQTIPSSIPDPQAEFTREAKSAVFIKQALVGVPKCGICRGYIHKNAITIDHIVRKEDRGKGTVDNGQLTHPYCNNIDKN